MKNKLISKGLIISILISAIIFNGCEKDKSDSFQLPPESSFVMDVSAFNSNTKSTQTQISYGVAALATLYWNAVISVSMAIPVASFKAAFNYEAERVTNDQWKWEYSLKVNDTTYTAKLYGTVLENGNINWQMKVSKENKFTDFLWFEGECNVQRTNGNWVLYESPAIPGELLTIDWNYNWENKTGDIKYIVVKEGDTKGNYIKYGVTSNTDFNVYYNLYNAQLTNLVEIKYNTSTKEGMIINAAGSFCWDSNQNDVLCE